jgi:hypothetical protein
VSECRAAAGAVSAAESDADDGVQPKVRLPAHSRLAAKRHAIGHLNANAAAERECAVRSTSRWNRRTATDVV